MKTAISLPDPLFEAANRLADHLGVSRSELFRRAMEDLLRRHDDARITEALDAVYGVETAQGALDPALVAMQEASLDREVW